MVVGARCSHSACSFTVWAPQRQAVELVLESPGPRQVLAMQRDERGYWRVTVPGVGDGTRYLYRLDSDVERPDPASHYQPDGVHKASQVVDHGSYRWRDAGWRGRPLRDTIQYELHVGTFTPEGTFEAVIPRLRDLADLGINAIELMPVAQFPGGRNWGYDGVYLYGVQNTYGGPSGLKRLVDAAHQTGLSVIMDVVYNHLGPEGNYLHDYGPYFTQKYKSPWGWAINFDGPDSDEVRNFFIENALMWFRDYHIDALRLDAIHGIFDFSARPFLQILSERVDACAAESNRRCDLIAESDLNDTRIIRPREDGGFGIPAQWSDDFHHALHTLLTGESTGYYADFGAVDDLVAALRDGYVYGDRYSRHRRRRHGNPSADRPAEQFVIFSQNHDQVGNRMNGDRLSTLVSFEALKLAAGAVLLSPYVPMLFMGEEYGEEAPFQYFVSHGDPDLVEAVRKGRKEEFESFGWAEEPPDPQSEATFQRCKLRWAERGKGRHKTLLDFYRTLIYLRRTIPALAAPTKEGLEVFGDSESRVVTCLRRSAALIIMNFANRESAATSLPAGVWRKKLDSAEQKWDGPGPCLPESISQSDPAELAPWNLAFYIRE